MMIRRLPTLLLAATVLFGAAASASAQTQPAPGPLVVEKIPSGWLFVPDVRAADLGSETGALAGGYLGRINDNSWVIGGGAYFLTNRDDDFKLAYGGPVVEWLVRTDRRIGFGVRTLVGIGSATLPLPITDVVDERVLASARHLTTGRRGGSLRLVEPTATIAVRDDFFVAEPQLNVLLNLSPSQRIVFGLGYRATGFANLLADSLNGVSGSIAYQFGGGK